MAKKCAGYHYRCLPLLKQIEEAIVEAVHAKDASRQMVEEIFWTVARDKQSPYSRNLKYELMARVAQLMPSFKARTLAFVSQGVLNIYEEERSLPEQ